MDPAPMEGVDVWPVQVPDQSQPLIASFCAPDQRRALYWANTCSG